MATFLDRITSSSAEQRSTQIITLEEYASQVLYQGHLYGTLNTGSMAGSPSVSIDSTFAAQVQNIHRRNGVVAAAVTARSMLMSQVVFKWRNVDTKELFGTRALRLLERPGAGYTRSSLLATAETHVCYAGNAFFYVTSSGKLTLLRPDWVEIILGSNLDPEHASMALDAEVLGYAYKPGGTKDQTQWQYLAPESVAHYKPEPDPTNPWRGLSWVSSVIREVQQDAQITDHVGKFFANAATPNFIFKFGEKTKPDQIAEWQELFERGHQGSRNAYKSIFMGGGADVVTVGSKPQDLALKDLRGEVESRVAARSRVPATILGVPTAAVTGGSSLNAGNYSQVRRVWADGWFTPSVQMLCESLETIMDLPRNSRGNEDSELWYDASEILFLQEDQKDAAEIIKAHASTIRNLIDAGFDPDAAVQAVTDGQLSQLVKKHTGLYSVQLQPAGTEKPPTTDAASA